MAMLNVLASGGRVVVVVVVVVKVQTKSCSDDDDASCVSRSVDMTVGEMAELMTNNPDMALVFVMTFMDADGQGPICISPSASMQSCFEFFQPGIHFSLWKHAIFCSVL